MPNPFDLDDFIIQSETGFFGVSNNKLNEIAGKIRRGSSLHDAAWKCGIDPANLTEDDAEKIRDLVDDNE